LPHSNLLQELVLVYAVAVTLLVIAGRLGVPSIVALITTGILAGPAGFALVPEQESVELLSEIGVALLLFMAGLDFSMSELRRVWRGVLIGGTAQVALTVMLVAAIVAVVSVPSGPRLFLIGMFVALSSTAIVLKELTRINQVHSPHGKLAIGILLLQDLIVIAVLVFAPMMLGRASEGNIGFAFLRFGLVLGGIFVASRLVLPLLLRLVSATSREAFTVAVLLASVGTAALASMLGLSMAVGAFLAGLVLAESEFSHQVHAEVRPLRDLLASLFFVSVGMLVDPSQMVSVLPVVIVLALGIMLVKFAGAGGALLLGGAPVRVAVAGAVALSQVGEFSFVLGRSALEAGVLSASEWQLLLGASVLTMAAAPTLVGMAPGIGARFANRASMGRDRHLDDEMPELSGHVIILGYGIGGRLLARALGEVSTKYLILELNGASVQEGRAKGEPIFYADATVTEPLEAAGVRRAAAIVCVLSDPDASERALRAVRALSPNVPVIVRSRFRLEAERMTRAGATLAVAEELEASLEVLAQLLMRLHIPGNVVEVLLDTYRRSTTTVATGRAKRAPAMPLGELPVEIADAPVSSFRMLAAMWGVGRTLGELALRAETGATVLAIRRGGRTVTSPDAGFRLAADDDLYILGDEADILLARHRLEHGPRPAAPSIDAGDEVTSSGADLA
jgi:monovalent cation:H+ antiporter-2, CPA2 family